MDIFTIIYVVVATVMFVVGVILMAKNIRPIVGFFMLAVALAMVIGLLMSPVELLRGMKNGWDTITHFF